MMHKSDEDSDVFCAVYAHFGPPKANTVRVFSGDAGILRLFTVSILHYVCRWLYSVEEHSCKEMQCSPPHTVSDLDTLIVKSTYRLLRF